jgi:hypothetical protein
MNVLAALLGLAISAHAAPPAVYTAKLDVEGRSYTLFLWFYSEERPAAEVQTYTRHFVDVPEFHNEPYAGRDICQSSIYLPLGYASMAVMDNATFASRRAWKENAPARLIVESRDWSGANKCGVTAGPLPKDAYAFIEGPLEVSILDPREPNFPLASIEARFVENAVVRSQTSAALAATADGKKLELQGFDGSAAPADVVAVVSRRKQVIGRKGFYWSEPDWVAFRRVTLP